MTFLSKVAITVAITFLGKVAVAVAITKKNVANRTLETRQAYIRAES